MGFSIWFTLWLSKQKTWICWLGQYLVAPALAADAAASLRGNVSVIFAHLDPDIFASLSWQNCSRSFELDWAYWEYQISSLATDSQWEWGMWAWLDYSKTFRFLPLNHSNVAFAVYLWLLSCWMVNNCSWKTETYNLRLPCICPPSTLQIKKHPHQKMLPPPCFTVGIVMSSVVSGILPNIVLCAEAKNNQLWSHQTK